MKLLRAREVQTLTGLSRSTIERLVLAGLFVKPVRITAHTLGWPEHEVLAWNAERIEVRDRGLEDADPVIRATSGRRRRPSSPSPAAA